MGMIKKFIWDMSWRQGRYEYLHWFTRNIPGHFGMEVRAKLLSRFFKNAGDELHIYQGVIVRGIHNLCVDNNVHIGLNTLINANGGITIGSNVLIGPGCKIWSVNHMYENKSIPISEQGYEDKPVSIGEGSWLGAGVIILPGTQLGKNVIVSAGAIISAKKYPDNILLAGNPARKVGIRE